jgi:UDP-N-acetylglucosamine 2-epimerase (non-hydrolysing)
MLVLSIVGTRPEAIKMAPVIRALEGRDGIESVVCSTGQHRQMLDQVFELFNIRPGIDLNVMQPNQTLAGVTGRLFEQLDRVVEERQPDWVLAQGDTTTVMVASLVAFFRRIKFGHVEAGLRTHDKWRPFPEEINRRIADLVADAYFAPTAAAKAALLKEGCNPASILVSGNTVVDALLEVAARPCDWSRGALAAIPAGKRLVTITAHRRESFGEPFRELCTALRELAVAHRQNGTHFIYPVHLNPNVQAPVREILSGIDNLTLLEPLDYGSLVQLLKRSYLVLTDSGGIQEEAPSFNVPVLVMRETTERPEGVEAGMVRLVGTSRERIVGETQTLLADKAAYARMARGRSPYGDGQAARRIVDYLLGTPTDEFAAAG